MFKSSFPLHVNLQLFAEGGAEGTGATGAAAAPQLGESPAQGVEQTSAAPTYTEEQFNESMKDKTFRGFVNKHTEGIVKNRLKGMKEQAARYEALDPVLDLLAQKYQTSRDDPKFAEILTKAVEEDDALYAEEAEKRGISIDAMRQISKTERENAAMRRQLDQERRLKEADEWYMARYQEAEELKQMYPSFDLEAELQNPDFVELIKLPTFNMRKAYEYVHMDEFQAAASQVVAQQTERMFANKMASNASRPVENGVAVTSAATAARDANSLTKQERDEIIRRVMAGERISLGGNLVSG